jgi:polar amino acid transport system substrate-binding protein
MLILACLTGCSDLPKDPVASLTQIKERGVIRAGVTNNPPWVVLTGGAPPAGIEPQLLQDIADSLGVGIQWAEDSEQDLVDRLEHFQLDIALTGMISTTPWSKKIGVTRPYYKDKANKKNHVMAIAPGENAWLSYVEGKLKANEARIRRLVHQNSASHDQ